jgi:DNA primase
MILNWVNFRAVKQAVSMEMALAYYGVMLRRVDGSYIRGRCPLPSHSSKSSSLSFIVNTEKNAWICHSDSCVASRGGRSGGNVLDFVAAMERCSIRDAALRLRDRFAVTSADDPRKEVLSAAEGPCTSAPTATGDCNSPLAFRLWDVDLRHHYLAERGVDHLTADHFGIGFYPGKGCMEGRIVIPIHNEDGILVAYAGRALDQGEPKYRFPARFRKSLMLFNLHRAARYDTTVVLVEGFFDCLRVHQAGLPCVVALMGCSLSQRQEALLQQHFRQVTVMLDGDNAGRRAGAMIAARLITKVAVRVVEIPVGSQPDRLSADQIRCLCDPDYF